MGTHTAQPHTLLRKALNKRWHKEGIFHVAKGYVEAKKDFYMREEGMNATQAVRAAYRDAAERFPPKGPADEERELEEKIEKAAPPQPEPKKRSSAAKKDAYHPPGHIVTPPSGIPTLPDGLDLPADVGWVYGHPSWRGEPADDYPSAPTISASNLLAHSQSTERAAQSFFQSVVKLQMDKSAKSGADADEETRAYRRERNELLDAVRDLIEHYRAGGAGATV